MKKLLPRKMYIFASSKVTYILKQRDSSFYLPTIPHINSETNPALLMINVVCKCLR